MPQESGEWLRRRRRERGWSQHDLERKSGIKQATISRLESGETVLENATLSTVATLAEAFGESISGLLEAAGVEQFGGLDPIVVQSAYAMQHLSPTGRAAVLACIEAQAAKEAATHDHDT